MATAQAGDGVDDQSLWDLNYRVDLYRAAHDDARMLCRMADLRRLQPYLRSLLFGRPERTTAPVVEFHQRDWMPGFAAFVEDGKPFEPDSRAFCLLNLGAILAAVELGDIPASEVPYFVAESMMHEVMHVLEKWAGVEFSEERIEQLLDRYRAMAHPNG